jgi:chloramphenicol 3-O-phosphotransferase
VVDRTVLGRPRAGPVALRILDGMYRGVVAMANAGVHVILDDVVWERAVAELAGRAMTADGVGARRNEVDKGHEAHT